VPAAVGFGGVDVDADEEDVVFSVEEAVEVDAAAAFFEGDVLFFGDEK